MHLGMEHTSILQVLFSHVEKTDQPADEISNKLQPG